MKKSILIKGLFLFVLPFTLSSCDEPSTPSEQPSITTPSVEPTPIYLNSPTLNINEENGLVTWNHVTYAEFYTYYINDEALKTTSKTSIELKSGDVLCVMAESSLNHVHSSSWSKPISYIDKNKESESQNEVRLLF